MTFTASGLLPAGIAVYVQRGRTELVWKCDIRLGGKALRLKAKDADQIDYCQLGKPAVGKASTQNKALADFQSEPRRASADSSISTASWSEFVIEREGFGRVCSLLTLSPHP